MTREEAKKIGLEWTKKEMLDSNKTLDDICLMSPKVGRDSWTYREFIEALENDKCLEDSNMNPIDLVLKYENHKKSSKQANHKKESK